eukprot:237167-Alexandrium_andersonii.AAC.1
MSRNLPSTVMAFSAMMRAGSREFLSLNLCSTNSSIVKMRPPRLSPVPAQLPALEKGWHGGPPTGMSTSA